MKPADFLAGLHLGQVLDDADPEQRGRIQVRLHATGTELWAPCVTGGAGQGYGVSQLPRVGEQVVVGFVSPDLPLVLGAVWSGTASHPEAARPVRQRYAVATPAGSHFILDDAPPVRLSLTSPAGHRLTIDDSGEILVEKGSERLRLHAGGITIESASRVEIKATAQLNVSTAMVQVDAGMSRFSGVVQCDTLIANAVVSATYTPGAGNVW